MRQRIVVVGGGFAGLACVQNLRRARADITLVDKRNFHLFQPLLYQVATGGLSPANIATPLRTIVRSQRNVTVLLDEVTGVDRDERVLKLRGRDLSYDRLVVAAGMGHEYYGNPQWEAHAPGLKTMEDAFAIRHRVLSAFERAEFESDEERRRALLTFVIVGAGPTGVEVAGALGEIARYTLRNEFRNIDPRAARIVLVEGGPRVLASFTETSSKAAQADLARLGVEFVAQTMVESIETGRVVLARESIRETIEAATVIWAAGVRASGLGAHLADDRDRMGRVRVTPTLQVPGHPEIYVVGDMALCEDEHGQALPGIAPVAMQQGRYVARHMTGKRKQPFRYVDRGQMAVIGRAAGVAESGTLRMRGKVGWLAWLLVHIVFLIQFQNKLLVLLQWAWNYFTFGRSARIITTDLEWKKSNPTA